MSTITITFKDGIEKNGKGWARYQDYGDEPRLVYSGGFAIVCWRNGKRVAYPAQDIEKVEEVER